MSYRVVLNSGLSFCGKTLSLDWKFYGLICSLCESQKIIDFDSLFQIQIVETVAFTVAACMPTYSWCTGEFWQQKATDLISDSCPIRTYRHTRLTWAIMRQTLDHPFTCLLIQVYCKKTNHICADDIKCSKLWSETACYTSCSTCSLNILWCHLEHFMTSSVSNKGIQTKESCMQFVKSHLPSQINPHK